MDCVGFSALYQSLSVGCEFYSEIANFVAPLSRAAVVQVSRPAPIASGGLEAASTAVLETGATILLGSQVRKSGPGAPKVFMIQ
jgi:hypothetical protein